MNRLMCFGFLALTIGIANGAVVREGDMMEMVQGMLSNPDQYAAALGMVRNKRSAWDKEFTLEKMGFSFKIKYNDASNRAKGGVAEVYFKDVRKFFRGVPAKSLKLTINFDNKNVGDMLFNLNVDYEVGFLFGGQDSGKVHFERKKDGSFYQFNFEFLSNSENNPDRPPTMKLELKSDWATKAFGKWYFNDFMHPVKEYNWELDFDKSGSFKGVFYGEKVFSVEGQYNDATKQVDLVFDYDGEKYTGTADYDFDGTFGVVKFNFDFGLVGKFDFEARGKKDMSDASVKFFLNDKDVFSTKVKGDLKKAPREFMYEARYTGMFVGDGKMRVAYKRFKELKVQYLPKTGMTFEHVMDIADGNTLNVRTTANYNEDKEFEMMTKFTPVNDANNLGYNMKIDWFIRDRNPFYRVFYQMNCLHCLGNFNVESNMLMQKSKLYKFDFDISSVNKDGTKHKEVYITTKDKYYALFSEHFLNEMSHLFNYNQRFYKEFELEGEWNAGKYLKVTSNRDWFKTLMIENMDGYIRKVMFNDKELMKAGFEQNGRTLKNTIELPSGKKMDTKLTWETDSFYKNKAKLTFDGPDANKVESEFDWDMSTSNKVLKVKAKGDNEFMGKFKLDREYKYQNNGGQQTFNLKGMTDIPASPLPNNLETEFEAKYTNPYDFLFGSYVLMAGQRFGFQYVEGFGFRWFF